MGPRSPVDTLAVVLEEPERLVLRSLPLLPPGPEDEAEHEDRPPKVEGPPNERILAPEDLDFTRDEKVEQLDDGKFVIGTGGEPRVPPEQRASATDMSEIRDPPTRCFDTSG